MQAEKSKTHVISGLVSDKGFMLCLRLLTIHSPGLCMMDVYREGVRETDREGEREREREKERERQRDRQTDRESILWCFFL